jgi:hypothetical protein
MTVRKIIKQREIRKRDIFMFELAKEERNFKDAIRDLEQTPGR